MIFPGQLREFLARKFVRDTLVLQVGDTLNLGVAFLTSVLLARLLGPSGYGVYALVFSLFGALTFAGDLGLAPATVTQLAEALARGERAAAAEFCGYFVKLSAVLGLAFIVVGLALGPPLAGWLYGRSLIGLLAGLLMADQLLGLPRNLVRVAFQSARRMSWLSAFEVGRGLVRLGLVALFLILGLGVGGVVLAELIAAALASLAAWPLFNRLREAEAGAMPSWAETWDQARRVPLRKHFAFGFKIVLDRNVVRVLEVVPFLILGRYAPAAEVGFLRLAWGAINLPLNLLTAIANNLAARLPQLRGLGDWAGLWRVFFRTSLAGGILSLAGVGLFALLAPWLIRVIYGAQFLPALPFVYILALGAALSGFFAGVGALYRTLYRVGLLVAANLIQLALYLPACYLLVKGLGTTGGAVFISGRVLALNLVAFGLALALLRRPEGQKAGERPCAS